MRSKSFCILVLLLLLALSFSLGTILQTRVLAWAPNGRNDSALKILLGDGRKLIAERFFVQADVSFHSGYYPTIFDQGQAPSDSHHMTSQEGSPEEEEHERRMNFLGKPRDCFEAFGRHFMITQHTHLEGGNEREILPWIRLSADLDPQRIDTYTVAAYWLRVRLGKVKEAEQFLREGLRANPDSDEILFELGRLEYESNHDASRARNLWELAFRRWQERQAAKKKPDPFVLEEITANLARLEENAGNLQRAIAFLEIARTVSPNPSAIQKQIDEITAKLRGGVRP